MSAATSLGQGREREGSAPTSRTHSGARGGPCSWRLRPTCEPARPPQRPPLPGQVSPTPLNPAGSQTSPGWQGQGPGLQTPVADRLANRCAAETGPRIPICTFPGSWAVTAASTAPVFPAKLLSTGIRLVFGEKLRGPCQEPTEGCFFPPLEPERRAGSGGERCGFAGWRAPRLSGTPTRTSPQRRDHKGVIHNRTGHSFLAGRRERKTKSQNHEDGCPGCESGWLTVAAAGTGK